MRARLRAEMTDEIKAIARRHLATEGANLSLRAVARDVGGVSSAIYRYFPSRDDLLTRLIIDGYDALGEAAEKADDPSASPLERWLAICRAVIWPRGFTQSAAAVIGEICRPVIGSGVRTRGDAGASWSEEA